MGAHAAFIAAAYGVAAIIVMGLILWVVADHRAQRRALAALEGQGITRRSHAARIEDTH
jgi:heme exporter protein D